MECNTCKGTGKVNEIEATRIAFTLDESGIRDWNVLLTEWTDGLFTVEMEADAGSPYMKVTDYYDFEFASAPSVEDILGALQEKYEEIADLQLN
jgi:hypothetical protein